MLVDVVRSSIWRVPDSMFLWQKLVSHLYRAFTHGTVQLTVTRRTPCSICDFAHPPTHRSFVEYQGEAPTPGVGRRPGLCAPAKKRKIFTLQEGGKHMETNKKEIYH